MYTYTKGALLDIFGLMEGRNFRHVESNLKGNSLNPAVWTKDRQPLVSTREQILDVSVLFCEEGIHPLHREHRRTVGHGPHAGRRFRRHTLTDESNDPIRESLTDRDTQSQRRLHGRYQDELSDSGPLHDKSEMIHEPLGQDELLKSTPQRERYGSLRNSEFAMAESCDWQDSLVDPMNKFNPFLTRGEESRLSQVERRESRFFNGTPDIGAKQPNAFIPPDKMRWTYQDPAGNLQGPFSGLQMHEWHQAGYFPPTLPVRRTGLLDFESLASLTRLLGPTPFLVPLPETQPPPLPSALEDLRHEEAMLHAKQRELLLQQQSEQPQYVMSGDRIGQQIPRLTEDLDPMRGRLNTLNTEVDNKEHLGSMGDSEAKNFNYFDQEVSSMRYPHQDVLKSNDKQTNDGIKLVPGEAHSQKQVSDEFSRDYNVDSSISNNEKPHANDAKIQKRVPIGVVSPNAKVPKKKDAIVSTSQKDNLQSAVSETRSDIDNSESGSASYEKPEMQTSSADISNTRSAPWASIQAKPTAHVVSIKEILSSEGKMQKKRASEKLKTVVNKPGQTIPPGPTTVSSKKQNLNIHPKLQGSENLNQTRLMQQYGSSQFLTRQSLCLKSKWRSKKQL